MKFKTGIRALLTLGTILGISILALPGRAQTATNQDTQFLLKKIEELEQRLKAVEGKGEKEGEAVKAGEKPAAKESPIVSLGASGLQVRSADSNFTFGIRGYVQVDGRFYLGDNVANDTFLLRRVRPIFEGTVWNKFDYRLMLDFASGVTSPGSNNNGFVTEAYLNTRLWEPVQFQVGKYKVPVGLERLQSHANTPFIENGIATQLSPNYDVGAMVHNGQFKNVVDYSLGIFNGVGDGASGDMDSTDDFKEFAARVFAQPFMKKDIPWLKGLGVGAGGSYGQRAGPTRGYVTAGQETFFSYATGVSYRGTQYRFDPQAFYYWGPMGVMGEYVISNQKVQGTVAGLPTDARFDNRGWQITGSWFVTGETNQWRPVSPSHPFGLDGGGWGALELVARYGELSLDDAIFPTFASATSAHGAQSFGVGVNWHLNRNIKFQLDYDHTRYDQGVSGATSVTANDENVVMGRVQFQF